MMTKRRPGKNVSIQYRFSLVEILVVVGIIAILLGLSGAGYNAVQRKIARARTEATINKIRIGLESYKSKYGYYPQQPTIKPFHLDINDFGHPTTNPEGLPQNNFNSFVEYSKMSKEDAVLVGTNYYAVTDGWKTAIREKDVNHDFSPISGVNGTPGAPYILYVCPGLVNTSSYDLFSAGHDRKFIWRDSPSTQIDTDKNDSVNTDNIWPQGLKTK
jgi:type II secretory pathway pseudopilin PulG